MKNLLLLSCILFISCGGNNLNPEVTLKGNWVETSFKTDTLEFDLFGDGESMLILKRGTELKDGQTLPKSASGPYDYKIVGNEISLRWSLSSLMESNNYYFKQTNDLIEIEDFYNADLGSTILEFRKID
jgi:hypothetical protein